MRRKYFIIFHTIVFDRTEPLLEGYRTVEQCSIGKTSDVNPDHKIDPFPGYEPTTPI